MEAGVILEFRVCQEQGLLPLLVRQEGLPGVMFPVRDVLGQVLVLAFRQQQDADDADERTAGEDDVVEEVAFLVVELHDGGGQAAKAGAGQDQPQPTSPANTAEVRARPRNPLLPAQPRRRCGGGAHSLDGSPRLIPSPACACAAEISKANPGCSQLSYCTVTPVRSCFAVVDRYCPFASVWGNTCTQVSFLPLHKKKRSFIT